MADFWQWLCTIDGCSIAMLFVGLIVVSIAATIIHRSEKDHFEGAAVVLLIIGACLIGASMALFIVRNKIRLSEKPRVPNVSQVVLKDGVITFPELTEVGANWCVVTDPTNKPKGIFVTNKTYTIPLAHRKHEIRAYIAFPDGNTSASAVLSDHGEFDAPGAKD